MGRGGSGGVARSGRSNTRSDRRRRALYQVAQYPVQFPPNRSRWRPDCFSTRTSRTPSGRADWLGRPVSSASGREGRARRTRSSTTRRCPACRPPTVRTSRFSASGRESDWITSTPLPAVGSASPAGACERVLRAVRPRTRPRPEDPIPSKRSRTLIVDRLRSGAISSLVIQLPIYVGNRSRDPFDGYRYIGSDRSADSWSASMTRMSHRP